jgi:hypothetical protein
MDQLGAEMLPPIPRLLPLAEIIEKAHRFISEMAARGIQPPNGSRVPLYLEALEEFVQWTQGYRDGDTVQRFVLGLQEISLLIQIFDWLKTPPEVPGWCEKFREILSGPFLPSDQADKPRDTQAELWFAGGAKHAGYRVELCTQPEKEPDVILYFENHRYAVEAKRPRSMEAIERRVVKKAAEQIAKRGLDGGLIFLDLSIAHAEERRKRFYPNLKVAEPQHLETPDHFPIFEIKRRKHLQMLLASAAKYIPPNLGHLVIGMSGIISETVLIGPQKWPELPPPFASTSCGGFELSPIGARFFSKFTYSNFSKGS